MIMIIILLSTSLFIIKPGLLINVYDQTIHWKTSISIINRGLLILALLILAHFIVNFPVYDQTMHWKA